MELNNLLQIGVEKKASDIHLSTGLPPIVRIDGDLERLDFPELTNDNVLKMVNTMLNEEQQSKLKEKMELDFSYFVENLSRFRVNAFQQSRGLSACIRIIPLDIPTLEDLDMNEEILKKICNYPNGIVLVTGPTGSGKSTTLAAMVNYLNSQSSTRQHILTIEDPIEYLFTSNHCLIQQREVGRHSLGFNATLKSALREDPDVIMVAEMRDLETIRLAMTAAETGHLVLSTLHTSNASKSLYRIIDVFPSGEKDLIRSMLSESLRAIVAQTLVKKPNGGRHAVQEILINNSAIRNLIREDKVSQIYSTIQTSKGEEMRTFSQHVEQLLSEGKILPPEPGAIDTK